MTEQLQVASINHPHISQEHDGMSISSLSSPICSKNRPGGGIWRQAEFFLHLLMYTVRELLLHTRLWLDDTQASCHQATRQHLET